VKLAPEGVGRVLEVLAGTGVEAVAIGEFEFRCPGNPNPTYHAPSPQPQERDWNTGSGHYFAGGIHLPNLAQLLHGSISPTSRNHLSGIATISDIVGSPTPKDAAAALRAVVDSFKRARQSLGNPSSVFSLSSPEEPRTAESLIRQVGVLMEVVRKHTPLVHQVSGNCQPLYT
jgi:thiamine-phosphate diphosphorylase/hydroxyethylthiazole kinase